ncbi:IS6 family transposase [Actibacterium sp. 188UL27-1]|uniref:IS6 family transposase n=1 Tax=Actibacterium sp. 188UL27-1 TaxID=2786961 RepID=UPI00195ED5AC|nr:IS6 family transposase [Actibacterium sp. 188UL27-1]MBM7070359.1 IS6 family transposase [Actibacterium sp. 188UL27-1]
MNRTKISYKRHRFPPQIISHAVWLYARFNLSLREVEEMLLERGVDVSYETVRRWMAKFRPKIAGNLRRRQGRAGHIWHLDEVRVEISGRAFWLWRAVDQEGLVLDEILQRRRDKRAARRLLRKLIKRHGLPQRIVTPSRALQTMPCRAADKLRSYGAAKRGLTPGLEHRSHKGLNNRAENSHLPFRKRERSMQGFRSPGGLQRYVSCHSAIQIRYHRMEAFDAWRSAARIA